MKMELVIGPSNGWLQSKGVKDFVSQNEIIKKSGSKAIEIHFRGEHELEGLFEKDALKDYLHKSLHLPKLENNLDKTLHLAKKLHELHNFNYVLLHPDTMTKETDWKLLEESNLPIAIENMDKRKSRGFLMEELNDVLQKYPFKFVLDVQHAYEHDNMMEYAKNLLENFADKICYLHVSGEKEDNNHSLVKDSTNKDSILKFLNEIYSKINVPIILEGEFIESSELEEEIKLISSTLD